MRTKSERPANRNLLEILGIADREDTITNLLCYCFRESADFRCCFLERVCGIVESEGDWQVRTRKAVRDIGTPDLVLWRTGPSADLVILENKLEAGEGADQTERYADPKCADTLTKELGLGSQARTHLCFLSLFPEKARNNDFRSATYDDLIKGGFPFGDQDELAAQLMTALYEVLTRFYSHSDLQDDDDFLTQLGATQAGTLDGGYLGFTTFLKRLSLPGNLEVEYTFRGSKQGRRFYGALITKDSWKSAPIEHSEGSWALPANNHHIHLEPQYNALSSDFQLYIHYETNPYAPRKIIASRVSPTELAAYDQRRQFFKSLFAAAAGQEFKLHGGTKQHNQIAKVKLLLSGRTVKESEDLVVESLRTATDVIDTIL